jgi:glycosyltransferase involved in cell wall biosynthesis
MVGIIEPRKNQTTVLDAAERLWNEGIEFSLTFVGRVNPFFGKPIAGRMRSLSRAGCSLVHLSKASDSEVIELLAGARFTLLPSLAEGCGLPVLESLWAGVPVICSGIPPLRESCAAGGCLIAPVGDNTAVEQTMRSLLSDDAEITRMANEAATRSLPTWRDTATAILQQLS